MASSIKAASDTVRVIGPAISCVSAAGMIPLRLTRPRVGRRPTTSQADAGERIELTVSDPRPTATMFAATATAVPPLDPPGVRERSYGFLVCPPKELTVVPARASSCKLVLPRMIIPASRLVEGVSLLERFGIDQKEGVQLWPILVISRDAVEIVLNQRM